MQRKYIPEAENRLLVLYALRAVGPLTDSQLLRVMTDTDLMNYITMQLTLADLEKEGFVRRAEHPAGPMLTPTEAGGFLLSSFESHIPLSRRKQVDDGASTWQRRFADEQTALAEETLLPDGRAALRLRLLNGRNMLADMTLALPENQGHITFLSERWRACMQQVYRLLLTTLSAGLAEGTLPPMPPNCTIFPEDGANWLVSGADDPEKPNLTLTMSLPGEALALSAAASLPNQGKNLRDAIVQLIASTNPED